MRDIDIKEPVFEYYRVDWSKPPPPLKRMVMWTKLTEYEAHTKNRAFGANGVTMRWIKADGQNADVE